MQGWEARTGGLKARTWNCSDVAHVRWDGDLLLKSLPLGGKWPSAEQSGLTLALEEENAGLNCSQPGESGVLQAMGSKKRAGGMYSCSHEQHLSCFGMRRAHAKRCRDLIQVLTVTGAGCDSEN